MSVLPVGIGASGDEYTIDNSLRFRNVTTSSTHWLERTSLSGTATRWTTSFWAKFSKENPQRTFQVWENISGSYGFLIQLSGDSIHVVFDNYTGAGFSGSKITNAELRDYSSWYHIVIEVDTNYASFSDDVVKIYINGVLQSQYNSTLYGTWTNGWTLNYNKMFLGAGSATGTSPQYGVNGYLTEINFIDGQALDATDFGEFDATTGVWKPKEYTGTYGTNGFYLPTTATTQAEGFNTVLYTGNGASQSIGDVGFTPDFVWIKKRSGAENHGLFDTVRGAGNFLVSNGTDSEYARGNSITTFDADGFSLGNYSNTNVSGGTNVAWCWDAGANQATTGISSVLYTASTSNGTYDIKGFGFNPDLLWIKNRNNVERHFMFDTVRGVDASKALVPSDTSAEGTNGTNGTTISMIDDGFRINETTITSGELYYSGRTYVAWGWDAGDGDPVTNTEGDVTTTVKANDATGFSVATGTTISSYSNFPFTVGHGLSTAPSMVIYKSRGTAGQNWWVWHKDLPNAATGRALNLNSTSGEISGAYFDSNPSSSTTVGINSAALINDNFVMYSFAEVSGVSSFGTYTGTGTTTGEVVTTGFRPGFLMVKRTNSTGNWIMLDATRSPFNNADDYISANAASAEASGAYDVEFTDTGFQFKYADPYGDVNASGSTYVYMAFKGSYSDYVSPLNTDGSKPSRVKANPEKGFSIVSWEYDGSGNPISLGHGLSQAPEMMIQKQRDAATDWHVWHKDLTSIDYDLYLQSTSGEVTNSDWGNTDPTSSVFYSATTGVAGRRMIGYMFHSVAGYSKIGSYTGNGSTTGPTVTTGFRPAFLMVKRIDSTGNWTMLDNTRSVTDNEVDDFLYANLTSAELANTTADVEFTSTGFQIKNTSTDQNASGGTYIYMAFAETRDAQFNFDASGNKNNWIPNNINSNASSESSYDIMTDVPTLTDEYTANYATANSLMLRGVGIDVAQGNLYVNRNSAGWGSIAATIGVSSGKFYWEFLCDSASPYILGVSDKNDPTQYVGYYATDYSYYYNGQKYNNASGTSYGDSYTNGDLIGFALDMDNGKIWFAKNGVWQASGDPEAGTNEAFSGITGTQFPEFGLNTSTCDGYINFGQRPFAYTPPTGFLPLNTYNLPDSTIEDGSEYMNTVTFSGTGATGNAITGLGFQPDMVWAKSRSVAANHELADIVRGTSKVLFPNLTNAEITDSARFESFDSDGFTLGANSNANGSGYSSVGWAWKANGSGSSNTDGSITSTVSANTTSGFSIVTYTGNGSTGTIGHGLGVAPSMMVIKVRNLSGNSWIVYHKDMGANPESLRMFLDSTAASGTSTANFNNTAPTSSVFSVGATSATNGAYNYIAYCFASVEGFSKFGSYTGNGSTDGPFIYTGFRPAWVLYKRTDATANWDVYDSTRDTYNPEDALLRPNLSNAEVSASAPIDFTAAGFKIRTSSSDFNTSGGTYIYAAFAENPFKNSLAR